MTDREFNRARGILAANTRWSNETNRTASLAPARAGFLEKLRREARERLGPGATEEQVAKAADNALQAHYARMRLNSLRSRQKAARDARDAMADALLAAEAEADAS